MVLTRWKSVFPPGDENSEVVKLKLEMLAIHLNLWLIKELDLISNFDQKMQEYCRNAKVDG